MKLEYGSELRCTENFFSEGEFYNFGQEVTVISTRTYSGITHVKFVYSTSYFPQPLIEKYFTQIK